VSRLKEIPGITGIKDSTADLGPRCRADESDGRGVGRDFALHRRGSDGAPFLLMGGHGVISVTANVAPKLMAEMARAALAGDVRGARNDRRLLPLHRSAFVEANPIPVKWARQWA
jgi:4-hydroxy-tetrahydrodipicolinate synthase